MASASALTTVQKLYIAYYGRAADAGGQVYWADKLDAANGSLVGIIDAFANSAEAQALYGTGTTNADRVTVLYQNILGRPPERAGLNYYVDQLNRGKLSLGNAALAILGGVEPGTSDAPIVDNRLAVADSFTSKVSTTPKSYDGDAAAAIARTFLKSVTGDAATVSSANTQLSAWLNTIGVASKQPAKFADLIAKGLLTNSAIVSSTLTEANLDTTLANLGKPMTGTVIDGYVAGATVYADLDGDGIQDPDEPSTVTDANGNYSLGASGTTKIVAYGGTDIMTGKAFEGVLTAPAGSTTVSPITTLVQAALESGKTIEAATTEVRTALGLPAAVTNILTYDPISALATNATDPTALAVQKAAQQVASVITQTTTAIDAADPTKSKKEVAREVIKALSETISNTLAGQTTAAPVDLSQAETLTTIVTNAATATGTSSIVTNAASVAQVTASSNAQIQNATTLVNLNKAAVVSQVNAVQALQTAATNNTLGDAATTFTNTVEQLVQQAETGNLTTEKPVEPTTPPAPPPPAPPAPAPAPGDGGGGGGNPPPPPPQRLPRHPRHGRNLW